MSDRRHLHVGFVSVGEFRPYSFVGARHRDEQLLTFKEASQVRHEGPCACEICVHKRWIEHPADDGGAPCSNCENATNWTCRVDGKCLFCHSPEVQLANNGHPDFDGDIRWPQ